MYRWLLAVLLLISRLGFAGEEVIHIVEKDETAWFLAQLYLGSGPRYPEILKFNHMNSPEEVQPGVKLRIDGAKFFPHQANFKGRYQRLESRRQLLLANKKSPELSPFALKRRIEKSPRLRAQEELSAPRSADLND